MTLTIQDSGKLPDASLVAAIDSSRRVACRPPSRFGTKRQAVVAGLAAALLAAVAPATANAIPAPPNTGNYCSITGAGDGWGFASYTSPTSDPCKWMLDQAPGSTIRRKGLYSTTGFNRVVYRCYPPGYGWVGIYQGKGNDPLTWAYNAAQGKPGCVFNVSQVSLPIFTSPFPTFVKYNHGTGFDFAKAPYNLLDVSEFGQPGSSAATIVDWRGRDRSNAGFINGHDGHDWGIPKNTPIYSVAAGTVVMARNFPTPCTGSDSKIQKEVAIRHTVSNPSGYRERFVTYYAHLSSYSVKVGDFVPKGKVIGSSGNTGCSSAPHLHFGTIRETNTADQPLEPVQWFDDAQHNSGRDEAIEPYGWDTPKGFDPWSYRAYPAGALSVNLWAAGKAPSTDSW